MLNNRKFKMSHRGVRILGKGQGQSSSVIPIEFDDINNEDNNEENNVEDDNTISDYEDDIRNELDLIYNRLNDIALDEEIAINNIDELIAITGHAVELSDELIRLYNDYGDIAKANEQLAEREHYFNMYYNYIHTQL